jgi:hypothetical protein
MNAPLITYIVKVGFHVNQGECFLEEHDEHAGGDTVLIESVLVHVGLLRKDKGRMLKTY